MPAETVRRLAPFGPLALCALVSLTAINPVLGISAVALSGTAQAGALALLPNLASEHMSSAWRGCCLSLFGDRPVSDQPLNDAMCAAFVSALDRVERDVWAREKQGWLRSRFATRPISDPEVQGYFQTLKQNAKSAFDRSKVSKDQILVELEQGPEHAWQTVDAFLEVAANEYPSVQGPFIDLLREKLPTAVKQEFDQQIWSLDKHGTAAWREYLELILQSMRESEAITATQLSEAIASLPEVISQQSKVSQEERDRRFEDAIKRLVEAESHQLLEQIKGVLAEHSVVSPDTLRVPSHHSNIPHRPSRYFIGRDAELDELHRRFAEENGPVALVQAIQGLGGVGKTQLAVHFAHRFSSDYAGIWWIRAETPETLVNDYVALAREVGLPVGESTRQEDTIATVRQYLGSTQETGERWLLIFDNASPGEPALASTIPSRGRCDVLITSRIKDWNGLYQEQNIGVLSLEDGAQFLQYRTGETDEVSAKAVAEVLGGLPLALEQAAAYVVAHQPHETLAKYLERFNRQPLTRLYEDKPKIGTYDEVVATTWMISFESVEAEESAAGDFLRLCAFLAPEQVPLELVLAQSNQMPERLSGALSDPDRSPNVIARLLRYSLVEPAGSSAIDVHRLVQLVVREWLTTTERELWASTAVRVINAAFPDEAQETETWNQADSLLAHGLAAAAFAESFDVESATTGQLLNRIGRYLFGHGQFSSAANAFERALALQTDSLGSDHIDVAMAMNDLGMAIHELGKYEEARPLHERALEIRKSVHGPDHPEVATSLGNLASIWREQGKLAEAQPLYERALEINEAVYGSDHPRVATTLNNFASLWQAQGKLAEAQPLYERALEINEAVYGSDHPKVAADLNNFASLWREQGKLAEAQPLYERALEIDEAAYGPDHPKVATDLNHLASLWQDQGKLEEARPLYERAIKSAARAGSIARAATFARALAHLEIKQGRIGPAVSNLKAALEFDQSIGNRRGEAFDFVGLAVVAQKIGSRSDVANLLILNWIVLNEIGHPDAAGAKAEALKVLEPRYRPGFDQKAASLTISYERDKGRKIIDGVFRHRR